MQAASTRPEFRFVQLGAVVLALLLAGIGANLVKDREQRRAVAVAMTGGNPSLAPVIFRRYGCGGCHTIPGISGAEGKVAGPLVDLRQRIYVGGGVNNTPENLVRWIVSPQRFSPGTAMPRSGISEAEARHLAAYLYAQ
ncbi:c-type cytochrome [Rhizobium terrae]|uniref:c-type cytochrome n=1 Tax=Rhizobium terrae TaxID=2171756 RepID=UPI000E3C0C7E|nr:cytochrome C [Rhizobium terrae]